MFDIVPFCCAIYKYQMHKSVSLEKRVLTVMLLWTIFRSLYRIRSIFFQSHLVMSDLIAKSTHAPGSTHDFFALGILKINLFSITCYYRLQKLLLFVEQNFTCAFANFYLPKLLLEVIGIQQQFALNENNCLFAVRERSLFSINFDLLNTALCTHFSNLLLVRI